MPLFFFFVFFFSCFFFVLTQKPSNNTLLAFKKRLIFLWVKNEKKISSDAFIFWIRCLYFSFSCSSLAVFFFVLTQKPSNNTLLAFKKWLIFLWVKNEKKISSDAFIFWIRCLYFSFSCSSLAVFFFVLTQKPSNNNLLAFKKWLIFLWVKNEKKISSDAFIFWIRCLYFSFSCSSLAVFFVLTQKPSNNTLLAFKKWLIFLWVKNEKKISSDAFIFWIRCLYFFMSLI